MGIIGAVVLALGGLTFWIYWRDANTPGVAVTQQPSPHIPASDPEPNYTSDPPTSGPHQEGTAPWGFSAVPISKTLQVHNLEDGGVVVNFQPDLDQATVDLIRTLIESYDGEVLAAPYPGLSHPVVLTAWNRIDRLPAWDEVRVRRFVDAFRGIDHHGQSGS